MRRLAALAAFLLPGVAAAQDQGRVYDPLPPPGSAYIRFVNTTDAPLALRPGFADPQRLGTDGAARVSAFLVAENVAGRDLAAEAEAGARSGQASLHVAPGSYTTVLVAAQGNALSLTPVADSTDFNQSRARLSFYNALPGCPAAKLGLPSGTAVFADVGPDQARSRSVNPVEAKLSVACGQAEVAGVTLAGLEAGGMYSVWLMQPGAAPLAFLSRDETAKWRR